MTKDSCDTLIFGVLVCLSQLGMLWQNTVQWVAHTTDVSHNSGGWEVCHRGASMTGLWKEISCWLVGGFPRAKRSHAREGSSGVLFSLQGHSLHPGDSTSVTSSERDSFPRPHFLIPSLWVRASTYEFGWTKIVSPYYNLGSFSMFPPYSDLSQVPQDQFLYPITSI